MKLGSGTGTFKLVVSKRAKYLLLNFEYGGIKPKKTKKEPSGSLVTNLVKVAMALQQQDSNM